MKNPDVLKAIIPSSEGQQSSLGSFFGLVPCVASFFFNK